MIAFNDQKRGTTTPDVELWRLTKDKRVLICFERSTQLGPELLQLLDGGLLRSELCRPAKNAQDLAHAWKVEAQSKGWSE